MEVATWVDKTLPRSHRYKMLDTSLGVAGLGGPGGPPKECDLLSFLLFAPQLESKALLLKVLTLWLIL